MRVLPRYGKRSQIQYGLQTYLFGQEFVAAPRAAEHLLSDGPVERA